jgi:hypothetical protein
MAGREEISRQIPGIYQFLRDANKLGPEFNKELKKASIEVAQHVVKRAQARASTQQERKVAVGLEARPDRIPKIAVSSSRSWVSASRPNRKRKTKAKVIDLFFGVEFGGGKYGKGNPAPAKSFADGSTKGGKYAYTKQFRPHRGRQGYFFYPTVREEGATIERLYGEAVQRVLRKVSG